MCCTINHSNDKEAKTKSSSVIEAGLVSITKKNAVTRALHDTIQSAPHIGAEADQRNSTVTFEVRGIHVGGG